VLAETGLNAKRSEKTTGFGSDLLLVQPVLLQRHHPSAEQVDTGAAIHRSLEGLQFVDLSFGLPVAPRFQHSIPNSLQVLAYRPRKTLHRVDPGRACIDQPSIQPLRRSTAKQAGGGTSSVGILYLLAIEQPNKKDSGRDSQNVA
jgi:hypothetical protein